MNQDNIFLKAPLFKKEINECKKYYGEKNIISSKNNGMVLIKNFKLPGNFPGLHTDIILALPSYYGYGSIIMDTFILSRCRFPHFMERNDIRLTNFIQNHLTPFEKLMEAIISILSFGFLKIKTYWFCLHPAERKPCTILEHLSLVYIALKDIRNEDADIMAELMNMNKNYHNSQFEQKRVIKRIKKEFLQRLPFPDPPSL